MANITAKDLNDKGVIALRDAIVKSACVDYLRYYKTDGNQSSYVLTIEKWFRSTQFDDLCTGYSGEWFIQKLREMVEEGIRKPAPMNPYFNVTL